MQLWRMLGIQMCLTTPPINQKTQSQKQLLGKSSQRPSEKAKKAPSIIGHPFIYPLAQCHMGPPHYLILRGDVMVWCDISRCT